jgi:Peptidase family S41
MKIHHRCLVILYIALFTRNSHAQNCDSIVEDFRNKILLNYAGFNNDTEKKQFYSFSEKLLKRSITCSEKLGEMVYYFNDPHLRVFLYAETVRNRGAYKKPIYKGPNVLEGYWKNERGDKLIKIVRSGQDKFEAIVVRTVNKSLKPGLLFYELKNSSKNTYKIKVNTIGRTFFATGQLQNTGVFTVGSIDKWHRLPNKVNADTVNLAPYSFNPTASIINNETVLIKIPECSFENIQIVDSLLKSYWGSLKASKNILIDLRENGGGTVLTLEPLLPYFGITKAFSQTGIILCSDDNIKNYETESKAFAEMITDQQIIEAEYRKVDSMKKYRGGYYIEPIDTIKYQLPDTAFTNKKIGILINYRTASAAKLFLLKAIQGKNVMIFGEPSCGALRTVEMNSFFSADSTMEIDIPMVRIQLSGIKHMTKDNKIRPDVFLRSADWINETCEYLKKIKNIDR